MIGIMLLVCLAVTGVLIAALVQLYRQRRLAAFVEVSVGLALCSYLTVHVFVLYLRVLLA